MLHPSYADLIKVVNSGVEEGEDPVVSSRYSIVMATSKRARQIIAGDEELVDGRGKKPLSVAVEELNEGKIRILTDESEEETEEVPTAETEAAETQESAETQETEEAQEADAPDGEYGRVFTIWRKRYCSSLWDVIKIWWTPRGCSVCWRTAATALRTTRTRRTPLW